MKERPILFSGEMVRAILDGRKTQTRRVVNPQPPQGWDRHNWYNAPQYGWTNEPEPALNWHVVKCRFGMPGDRLWVRETWKYGWTPSCGHGIFYRADEHFKCFNTDGYGHAYRTIVAKYGNDFRKEPWRSSIFMPCWASRIKLEVIGVRVERLNEISEEDAIAEGCRGEEWYRHPSFGIVTDAGTLPSEEYHELWDSINGKKHPWASNPWVWCVEFKPIGAH